MEAAYNLKTLKHSILMDRKKEKQHLSNCHNGEGHNVVLIYYDYSQDFQLSVLHLPKLCFI